MILSVQEVTKRYDKHLAVDKVSFDMREGTIFGMLGPNGAGKTSLIRMITTITGPDEGVIMLDGQKINATTPEKIGYMPEERGMYKKMKVGEQLIYLAELKGLSKSKAKTEVQYWLERLNISDWWDKKIEDLSKGMQQKVQFITTIVHRPRLLILDEPFSGLDPINAEMLKQEIISLHNEGLSIIFSTHRMEQVEEMCDDIILINKGRNVLCGDVNTIKNDYKQHLFFVEYTGEMTQPLPACFHEVEHTKKGLTVKINDGCSPNDFLRWLLTNPLNVISYKEILPTFNEIFIRTVGAS